MNRTALLIAAAAATALTLSACTTAGDDSSAGTSTTGSAPTSEQSTSQTPAEVTEHNAADVMFAQMMMPHHEQAIVMSDIILAKDGIPADVASMAENIKAAQGPEIAQLTEWLEQWGEPTAPHNDHSMSEMDGMLSEQQLQQLSDSEGVDAARLFMEQMIAHHEGAVTMAEDQVADGNYQPAIDMAHTIIDTQQQEIETMRGLLATL